MPTEKSFLLAVKEYLLITIGILCYVSGWSLFLLPNNLVGGGVSGLSSIIQYATGFKMGYTYFIVNAGLLVIAFLILGAGFGGKTIYAIILASVGLSVLPDIIPLQIIDTLALQNGKLMSVQYYKNLREQFSQNNIPKVSGGIRGKIKNNKAIRYVYDHGIALHRKDRSKYFKETQNVILHGCCLIFTPKFFRYFPVQT